MNDPETKNLLLQRQLGAPSEIVAWETPSGSSGARESGLAKTVEGLQKTVEAQSKLLDRLLSGKGQKGWGGKGQSSGSGGEQGARNSTKKQKPGPAGKKGGGGKGNKREWQTPDGQPICFRYNEGKCKGAAAGQSCDRGFLHVCSNKGCGGLHPANSP